GTLAPSCALSLHDALPIYGHVVAVVRRPAQRQLGEISGSNYHAAGLIRDVHQDLCALPCLGVLIRYVMVVYIVSDVLKMLLHSRSEEHTSELQSRFDLVCR